jgi:translation initiation factor IF-2
MLRAALAIERKGRPLAFPLLSNACGSSSSSSSSHALYQTKVDSRGRGGSTGRPPPPPQSKTSATSQRDTGKKRVPPARDWTPREEPRNRQEATKAKQQYVKPIERKLTKVKRIKEEELIIPLPPFITVSDLARVLNVRLRSFQNTMITAGLTDTRPDLLLPYSDAEILLLESNATATPLSTASNNFDIYPRPPAAASDLEERPPVIAIMGHVDHGKTTLLDKLRSASVAAGEAGGITQHVGAFSVEVKGGTTTSSKRVITFLDTPGHAAFTKMRGRGAKITDIVVLVVASDDGVMPQTKEVLQLIKEVQEEEGSNAAGGLQLVVALSKVDKQDANVERVKSQLFSEGVNIEEFGGDVPCVEISGKTGQGLDKLQDTLVAMSELNDLKAERKGPAEGFVIESRVERGLGSTALVLIKRGILQVGDYLVAGHGWSKVRKMLDSSGQIVVKKGFPGDAVLVTGWRDLPKAGDLFLGVEDIKNGEKAEELVKRCLESRKRVEERRKLGQDVLAINENRRVEAEERERAARLEFEERRRLRLERLAKTEGGLTDEQLQELLDQEESALEQEEKSTTELKSANVKELRLVVRADYSGTVEAVVGAIAGIGNHEVKVKIVSAGVGEPNEGDIAMAQAVEGQVLGFNVKASRSLQNAAAKVQPSVKVHCDDVIYRLMTYVTEQCVALLPVLTKPRIAGEATIQQVFSINVKGRTFKNVAGCRVTNGTISKSQLVRVLRLKGSGGKGEGGRKENDGGDGEEDKREIIYQGRLDSLKQVKKEVDEMKRGTECGLSFENFQGFQKGDFVQSYFNEEIKRSL